MNFLQIEAKTSSIYGQFYGYASELSSIFEIGGSTKKSDQVGQDIEAYENDETHRTVGRNAPMEKVKKNSLFNFLNKQFKGFFERNFTKLLNYENQKKNPMKL